MPIIICLANRHADSPNTYGQEAPTDGQCSTGLAGLAKSVAESSLLLLQHRQMWMWLVGQRHLLTLHN